MESKILNFPEAMELAKILDKSVPVEIPDSVNAIDFISSILSIISPLEFQLAMNLLTGLSNIQLAEIDGNSGMNIFIDGLDKNRILPLMKFFRQKV